MRLTQESINALATIGIQIKSATSIQLVGFERPYQSEILFVDIKAVTLKNAEFSFGRKVLFWTQRILTWNSHFQQSRFDEETEYRFWQELSVHFWNGEKATKKIRDIDLIGVQRAIDELNEKLI
ncbi:MAG: hypothetical protein AAF487_15315 [Bacteroidota bacterium]